MIYTQFENCFRASESDTKHAFYITLVSLIIQLNKIALQFISLHKKLINLLIIQSQLYCQRSTQKYLEYRSEFEISNTSWITVSFLLKHWGVPGTNSHSGGPHHSFGTLFEEYSHNAQILLKNISRKQLNLC